ncbi:MAG: hypothetical protein QOJ76_1178, partial [Acidobacteriota bacterium]|nr:hypothetical protein [Acidobacteriota bacterium]
MTLNRTTTKLLRTALALCAVVCLFAFAPTTGARRFGTDVSRVEAARAEYAKTREGRLRIFDEVWEQVRERYFDPGFQGVDWQEVRRDLRPLAAEARDEAELYAVLRRMLGA